MQNGNTPHRSTPVPTPCRIHPTHVEGLEAALDWAVKAGKGGMRLVGVWGESFMGIFIKWKQDIGCLFKFTNKTYIYI